MLNSILTPDELAEVLQTENPAEFFIAGRVDSDNRSITPWRGNLDPLTVPFSAFEASGDGIEADFGDFSITDFGQTVRFGCYESAADAILKEFDPERRTPLGLE